MACQNIKLHADTDTVSWHKLLFIDSTFVFFRRGIDRKTRDQVFLLKQENSCKSFKDLQEFSKRGVFISLLFLERLSLI
jgi:hypothetical protein